MGPEAILAPADHQLEQPREGQWQGSLPDHSHAETKQMRTKEAGQIPVAEGFPKEEEKSSRCTSQGASICSSRCSYRKDLHNIGAGESEIAYKPWRKKVSMHLKSSRVIKGTEIT